MKQFTLHNEVILVGSSTALEHKIVHLSFNGGIEQY